MVNFINKRVSGGDIILFHDSGHICGTEGGRRAKTVKAVDSLIKILKERGFEFVSLKDLRSEQSPV